MSSKAKIVQRSDASMRAYCDELRKVSAAEFKYMLNAAAVLRAALVKGGGGHKKAWLVSWHFVLAAHCAKSASGHAVAAYASFLKWFEPELQQAIAQEPQGEVAKKQTEGFQFGSE